MPDQKLIIILCTIALSIFFTNNVFNEINATYVRVDNDNNSISNQFFSMNVSDTWLYQESTPNSPATETLGIGIGARASLVPIEDFENAKNRIHDYANIFIEQDTDFDTENLSLDLYVNHKKESIQAKIVNETNIQLDGEDAIKVNYLGNGKIEGAKLIVIYAIHQDKPYFIQYMGFGDKFSNRLSDFKEMLSTFRWKSSEGTDSLSNTTEGNYKLTESIVKQKNSDFIGNSSIYQGLGIKIKYFDPWKKGLFNSDEPSCHNIDFCVTTLSLPIGGKDLSMIWITQDKFDSPKIKSKCKCDTLSEYAKYEYENTISGFDNFSFINDNQSTIADNKPVIQLEYDMSLTNKDFKSFTILTNDSNSFYQFTINADKNGSYSKNIQDFKKMINSVEFISTNETKKKQPSFMISEKSNESTIPSISNNENEIEFSDLGVSNQLDIIPSSNELTILSHDSYINSVGNMHIIGEVENNSPNIVEYVKIIGTFYDDNNKVVGTSFTFTEPNDLNPKEKAPFDLILSDATIPAEQIARYDLKITYN